MGVADTSAAATATAPSWDAILTLASWLANIGHSDLLPRLRDNDFHEFSFWKQFGGLYEYCAGFDDSWPDGFTQQASWFRGIIGSGDHLSTAALATLRNARQKTAD